MFKTQLIWPVLQAFFVNMKQFFLIPFFFLLLCSLSAQIKIEGQLSKETKFDSIYLAENIGGKFTIIESATINANKSFLFKGKYLTGYYAIWKDKNNYAQIIINSEDIIVHFNDSLLRKSVNILKSEENKKLWKFIYIRKEMQSEISQVYMQKTEHDNSSKEFWRIDSIEKHLKKKYDEYILSITKNNSNSFLAKTIISDIEVQNGEDFFKYVDFSDERLIRSGVITNKITEYLQFKTEYTEQGFIRSIDHILLHSSENQIVYEFTLNYLLELFNAVGPDIILNYLIEEYVIGDACTDLDLNQVLNNKLNAYKRVSIGKKAPNISAFDINGVMKNLHDLCSFSKLNILYFGSNHCSFCSDSNPEIIEFLENDSTKHSIQLIYISLDTHIKDWGKSLQNKPKNWISISELNGWDSKSTEIFQVHKTPTFYILGQDANIISKPKNLEELITEVKIILN